MSGSLLGCIKYGGILPGDNDIDIGTWSSEREDKDFQQAIESFETKGFKIEERYDPAHERLKGMITLTGGTMRIDIKFYEQHNDHLVRSIHRNNSEFARIIWVLVDALYFGSKWKQSNSTKRTILQRVATVLPFPVRGTIIKILSYVWRKSDTEYGLVVLPAAYFQDFATETFLGHTVPVPENAEEYLLYDYGTQWKEHNPSGKGGAEKPSHVLYTSQSLESISDKRAQIIEDLREK